MNLGFNVVVAVFGVGGTELIVAFVVGLLLFGARKIPPNFMRGFRRGLRQFNHAREEVENDLGRHAGSAFGKPVADALTHSNQTAEFQNPPELIPSEVVSNMRNKLILLVAQGFGAGRAPFAPGTFGSVVGLGWFALLLAPGSFNLYLIGTIAGLALSVWICGEAEKILGQRDPGSIVLDEIAAIPLCFFFPIFFNAQISDVGMSEPSYFFNSLAWPWTLGIFIAFRVFDIWKPWPVRQSQSLPGGWGVTVDDALAAVYVNLATAAVFWAMSR